MQIQLLPKYILKLIQFKMIHILEDMFQNFRTSTIENEYAEIIELFI